MLQPKYFVYCGYCHLKTLDPSSPSSAGLKLEVIYAPCHETVFYFYRDDAVVSLNADIDLMAAAS